MMSLHRQFLPMLVGAVLLLVAAAQALGLQADQLLLIVNRNMPESRELAELYAATRGVPDGRILELDLPQGESMGERAYRQKVVPAVRGFLREHELETQVTCIVTFYGVPLRIGSRQLDQAQQTEFAALREQRTKLHQQVLHTVTSLEQLAGELSSNFQPPTTQQSLDALTQRADAAIRTAGRLVGHLDPARRAATTQRLMQAIEVLSGPAGVVDRMAVDPNADPQSPQVQHITALRQRVRAARQQFEELRARPQDPEARAQLRELVAENFGLLPSARLVEEHITLLDAEQTSAAFDSELALLWWDAYPRSRWVLNPLHHGVSPEQRGKAPRVLMVSRIDAPTPEIARRIIEDSVAAEREGLRGNVAIDVGGSMTLAAKVGDRQQYGVWDSHLQSLARMVREHTDLKLILDQAAQVFQPGDVPECAVYCGWYSLRNYVPAFEFVRGAVGYHIASFELKALRDPEEKGWVANLLRDGVVATVGPVDEPYLQAFPQPDEFFSLLLAGQMTLAEVYWTTTPMASWQMVLIGDPLYRPFGKNPPLAPSALPENLREKLR